VGAEWLDLLGLLPALHLDRAPRPEELFEHHPVGRRADPAAVDVFLAVIAGYFTRSSLLPPSRGLAGLRAFQDAQGRVCRDWLASRTGWR
jgi:hypothetical protein